VSKILGQTVPACDHLPTHEPDDGQFYLGYGHYGEIDLFEGPRFDWQRGWIRIGNKPTVDSVCFNIIDTYIEACGRVGDDAFVASLFANDDWSALEYPGDAFIFQSKYGIDFAAKGSDGRFWSSFGYEVNPSDYPVAVPVVLV
jgi:hypothetical protein